MFDFSRLENLKSDNLILQILYICNIIRTYLKAMKKSISNDFVLERMWLVQTFNK